MVYRGRFHISMPRNRSFTYTAFYFSEIQYILAYLLPADHVPGEGGMTGYEIPPILSPIKHFLYIDNRIRLR